MIVCGHGNVKNFCDKYEMVVATTHDGPIEEYKGICRVLVTDQEMSEEEYLYLKKKMLLLKVELVSTQYCDEDSVVRRIVYELERELEGRKKYVGRCKFGQHRVNGEVVPHEEGMKVVRRIIELRDKGFTYSKIQEDDDVHDLAGRMLGLSTIALIVKNREEYGL